MMDKDDLRRTATGASSMSTAASGGNKISPRLIVIGVLVAMALIFFFRNGEQTKLDFLFITTHNKTRWLVIVSMAIGAVLDRVASGWFRRRKAAKNS
jgi:uncharacterized integral membrane protein